MEAETLDDISTRSLDGAFGHTGAAEAPCRAGGIGDADPATSNWAGWPGGKGAGGVAERIVGLFPFHEGYFEPFIGYGAVWRKKTAATLSIGTDVDPAVVAKWRRDAPSEHVIHADAMRALAAVAPKLDLRWVVYIDAPYLRRVRTRSLYDFEFDSPEQHAELLDLLLSLRCCVAVSHYADPLYEEKLWGWRSIRFKAQTRGGPREECVWMNFVPPRVFHDPMYANIGYRERDRVKRRIARWRARFERMTSAERQCVRRALALAQGTPLQTPVPDGNFGRDVLDVILAESADSPQLTMWGPTPRPTSEMPCRSASPDLTVRASA